VFFSHIDCYAVIIASGVGAAREYKQGRRLSAPRSRRQPLVVCGVCCGGRHAPTPIMPNVEEFIIDSVDSVFAPQPYTGSGGVQTNRNISKTGPKSGESHT
jgi:hypothetical protein